jgi:hypothetical protein
MEENQNNIGFVEKLALIADACENLIPARANILFQLNENDYSKVCEMVNFKQDDTELKVDVGTTSFIFIREGKL